MECRNGCKKLPCNIPNGDTRRTPKNGGKIIPTFALKFGLSDPKRNLLGWCLIPEQTLSAGQLIYFVSYRAIYLETRHSFTWFELRIVSMGFK